MPDNPMQRVKLASVQSLFLYFIRKIAFMLFLFLFSIPCYYPSTTQAEEKKFLKQDLFSVCFVNDSLGWTCGRWGLVLHTEDGGKTWIKQASGTDYTLLSICFISPEKGWAVGDGGTIIHTEDGGQTWVKQPCPVDYYLMGACFLDDQNGWIATEWTNILHTEDGGKTWEVQFSEADYILKSVSFCDPLNGWAAGEYGYIYHTSDGGKTWEHQAGFFGLSDKVFELVGENSLFSVFAIDPMTAWAVGIDGYVTMTDDGGKTWQKIEGNFPATQLFGISSDKHGNISIVGNRSLLFSSDAGKSFVVPEIEPSIIYGWLYGCCPRGSNGFVAVGKEGWIYLSDNKGSSWQRCKY